jgi:hypothetical protein
MVAPVTRRFGLTLTIVAAVGLVARIVYMIVVAADIDLGADARWYQLQAGTIAGGHGYVDPDAFHRLGQSEPTANFPPLWPIVLAVFERLGLSGDRAFQMVGTVVGTATVVLTGLLGRRVVDERTGLVAASLVALSPLAIAADGSLMAESLFVALLTAATLLTYRASDRPSAGSFALLGAVLGLAALTRTDALLYAPLLATAAALGVRATSARRMALATCSVGVALVMLVPWTIRNVVSFDDPILGSTNAASVIEGANCPSTYSGDLIGAWDADCLRETRRPGATETEWAAAARRSGIDYAAAHVERTPLVGAVRVLRTWGLWNPLGQTELEAVESRNERWQQLGWAVDFVMLGFAVVGTALLVRRRAQLAPLIAVAIGVCLVALVSYGSQRFRLPAVPAVAIAAATAFVTAAMSAAHRLRSQP